MSEKSVSRLIREGNYSEADYQANMLDPVMKLVFQSRIAELTGYFPRAKKLSNEALQYAKSSDQRLAAAIAQAYANWRLFEFIEGYQVLQSVTAEVETLRLDRNPWVGTYYNIEGLLYWKEGRLDEAFRSFETSLVIRQDIGENSAISYTLNNLGNTYLSHKDYEQAEKFFQRSKDLRVLLGHKPALAASANSFGRLYDAVQRHSAATEYHKECLALWKSVGNIQFIAKAYRFLAMNAYHLGYDDQVKEFIEQSDQLFTQLGNKTDISTNASLKEKYIKI